MSTIKKVLPLSRRAFVGSALAGGALLAAAPALAQQRRVLEGDVTDANLRPRPIAIPEFLSDDPRLGADISNVVANDLESSGLFQPLDRGAFLEQIRDLNVAPRFADWRSVGA